MQRPLASAWCTTTPFTSVLPAAANSPPRPAAAAAKKSTVLTALRPRKNPRCCPPRGRGRGREKKPTVLSAPRPRPHWNPRFCSNRSCETFHGFHRPAPRTRRKPTVLTALRPRKNPRFTPPRCRREKIHGFFKGGGRSAGIAEQNARRQRFSLAAIPCRIYRISSDLRSQAAQGLVSTRVGDCLGTPSGAASFSSTAFLTVGATKKRKEKSAGRLPCWET